MEYEGVEYLMEVKGIGKSVSLTHLRQLNDYVLKYQEDTGKACKGILFGNAWRTHPPEERNTSEKPEFPANVISRSQQWGVALVSSTRFFNAFREFMEDPSVGPAILSRVLSTSGEVLFD